MTSIDRYAFCGCKSLTSINIPNSVLSIGKWAFSGCTSLTSIDTHHVLSLDVGAFAGCTSLASVDISNSMMKIEANAFWECTSLTSVKIGNSVTSISDNVFTGSTNLNKLEVGNAYGLQRMLSYTKTLIVAEDYSDTTFPSETYSDYTKLETIVCKLSTPPTLYDTFNDEQYENIVVKVPTESLAAYQSADVWKKFRCLQGGAEKETSAVSTAVIGNGNKPEVIYDLQGRRLKAPQKGLNIINGRKVLVK